MTPLPSTEKDGLAGTPSTAKVTPLVFTVSAPGVTCAPMEVLGVTCVAPAAGTSESITGVGDTVKPTDPAVVAKTMLLYVALSPARKYTRLNEASNVLVVMMELA